MSFRPTNKKFILLPHSIKTALSLSFKRNYVDLRQTYLALKLKLVKSHVYDSYRSKVVKMDHKEEAKADEEQEVPFPLVTYVNNILTPFFSDVEVYINNQKVYKSSGLYAHKCYNSNNFKRIISVYKGVLHCEGYDYEDFLADIMEEPSSEPFSQKKMKMLCRTDGIMLYRKLGVDFLSNTELRCPKLKIRFFSEKSNSAENGHHSLSSHTAEP